MQKSTRKKSWIRIAVPIYVVLIIFAVSINNDTLGQALVAIGIIAVLCWAVKWVASKMKHSKGAVPQASQNLKEFTTAKTVESPKYTKYGNMIVRDTEVVGVKVAGVTFKNGRRTRQAILRAIKWGDAPYDGDVSVEVKKTVFDGADAFEVWANNEMIGYVPKTQVPFFSDNWHRYHRSIGLEVVGGGERDDGEQISYGASFHAQFYL